MLGIPSFRYVSNNKEKHNDKIIPQEDVKEYLYRITIDRVVRKPFYEIGASLLDEQVLTPNKNEYFKFEFRVDGENELHNSDLLIKMLEAVIETLKVNKDRSE